MEIEYIENENLSEIIPGYMMNEELSKIVGNKVILQWLLAEPNEKKVEKENGNMYQEIIINQVERFSEKLNSTFFYTIANQFKLKSNFGKKLYLFFKLEPIAPPKQNSRISWWDGNIVCIEYQDEKWEISNEKIWLMNEIYDKILKRGEVRIKNDS